MLESVIRLAETTPAEPVTPIITSDLMAPVVDTITANVTALLPIGLGLFGLFVVIGLIPRLFKRFTRA